MTAGASPLTIFLLDDHNLFRKGLTNIIESMGDGYRIIGEAGEGQGLVEYLQKGGTIPDILILDINMPGMDGFQTIAYLNEHYPDIKVLVVSMIEKEETILRMLKAGAKGYLSKDVETSDLKNALHAIHQKGFYYTDFLTGRLVHQLQKDSLPKKEIELNSRELEILKLTCTELTYKEIAQQLFLSIKTIDTYRDSLFRKIGATSRVGLVIYAIRNNIVQV
jgi:DNA-binding NarL/FixJ family response regulator